MLGNTILREFWNKPDRWVIIGILLLAFGFRVWGSWHGLPFSYYDDERHFVNRAVSFGSGDLNPHWFHKPAFYMYLLFMEYGVLFLLGKLVGLYHTVDEFARFYFSDASVFYLIGRLTTVVFGVATVYLIYFLAGRMFNKRVGLLSALFLTFTFAHVSSSQYIKADIPAAFFVVLSFVFIYFILERGSLRYYLLAGAFAGVGAATKYSPILLLVPIFVTHLLRHHGNDPGPTSRRNHHWLLYAFVSFWIAFFLASPYNFLDLKGLEWTFQPIFELRTSTASSASPSSTSSATIVDAAVHFLGVVAGREGMGVVFGALSGVGVGLALFRGRRGDIVILSYLVTFVIYVTLERRVNVQPRHLNVIYPFLGVFAAQAVDKGLQMVRGYRLFGSDQGSRKYSGFSVIVVLALILPSAYYISGYDYLISHKDTRSIAKDWVEKNIPVGTRIIVDEHSVPLRKSRKNLKELYARALKADRSGAFTAQLAKYYKYQMDSVSGPTYDLEVIKRPWWKKENQRGNGSIYFLDSREDKDFGNPVEKWGVMPFDYYLQQNYEYVVTTSDQFGVYIKHPDRMESSPFGRFYKALFECAELVWKIEPHPRKRPGPEVRVYRLPRRQVHPSN